MRAAYYDEGDRIPKTIEAVASLLGRPGLMTAKRTRDAVIGSPQ